MDSSTRTESLHSEMMLHITCAAGENVGAV